MQELLARALARFDGLADATLAPLGAGLINETYEVASARGRFVLQRVSAIFDPRIHQNIEAVTRALERAGLETPTLLRARDGGLHVVEDRSVFRVMTYVEGATFKEARGPEQARSAGRLVGRFHRAVEGLSGELLALRQGVHDTAAHLRSLGEALDRHRDHRLWGEVEPLGRLVLERASRLQPLPALEPRPCHGDLKLDNVRFRGERPPGADEAVCLVDLDTVGPMHLGHELGDAWRSWCNRAGEDRERARLDLGVLEASLEGYLEGVGRRLTADERRALLLGPDWVSLELAARFAADALAESYFGWDRTRFPGAGEHNLCRARGQLSLFEAFAGTRDLRARLLDLAEADPVDLGG